MNHSLVNTMRVAAVCLIVAALCIVMIPNSMEATIFENGTGAALEKYYFYNMDFSKTAIGAEPPADQGNVNPNDNMTFLVCAGGPVGQYLEMSSLGKRAVFPKYTFDMGHNFAQFSGVLYFSYDFIVNKGATQIDSPTTQIGLGSERFSGGIIFDALLYKTATDAVIRYAGTSVHVDYDEWHNVTYKLDIADSKAYWYVDGVEKKNSTVTFSGSPTPLRYVNVGMGSCTNDTYDMKVGLTNIELYTMVPSIHTISYPDESAKMCIIFDDAMGGLLSAPAIMRDQPGTIAVVIDWVGDPGYLTWDQIQTFSDLGWEIMSHSVSHAGMTSISSAQIHDQASLSKQYIEENVTCEVKGWVYPGNLANDTTSGIIKQYYDYQGGSPTYHEMHRIASLGSNASNSLNWAKGVINAALYGKNNLVTIYSHNLSTTLRSPYNLDIHPSALQFIVDTLESNDMTLVTPSESVETYRNGRYAELSGNATRFSLDFGTTHNYANESTYIVYPYGDDDVTYVAVSDGDAVDTAVCDDGLIIFSLVAGDYQVYTLSDYRSMQMEESFGIIFAIIPLVIIMSVIPIITGLGKKLK